MKQKKKQPIIYVVNVLQQTRPQEGASRSTIWGLWKWRNYRIAQTAKPVPKDFK